MSEEIKVGDWVEIPEDALSRYKITSIEGNMAVSGFFEEPIASCRKVYVSDTPPPPIKMAGYDKPKMVQYLPETAERYGMVFYDNGMRFLCVNSRWKHVPMHLPHEQDDLKHLFE